MRAAPPFPLAVRVDRVGVEGRPGEDFFSADGRATDRLGSGFVARPAFVALGVPPRERARDASRGDFRALPPERLRITLGVIGAAAADFECRGGSSPLLRRST